jgi:hypothetical protein
MQIAQNETGVALTVADVTGAPLPNAHVELVNKTSKARTAGTTNAEGLFRWSHLEAGPYLLTVRVDSFQDYTEMVQVQEHRVLKSTITLKVGALMGDVVEVVRIPVMPIEPASYPALELVPLQAMPAAHTVRHGSFRRVFSTLGRKLGL